MKKVVIDQSGCIGCGNCVAISPDVFQMNDEDLAEVYAQPNDINDEVLEAVDSCPTEVISIEEE